MDRKAVITELKDFMLNKERSKNDRDRWGEFEHCLRYLTCDLKNKVKEEDRLLIDDIKQAIIVFVMKDKFGETNAIFLENTKRNFYDAIQKLEKRHPDMRTFQIKIFMEDFYFN